MASAARGHQGLCVGWLDSLFVCLFVCLCVCLFVSGRDKDERAEVLGEEGKTELLHEWFELLLLLSSSLSFFFWCFFFIWFANKLSNARIIN